MLICMIENSFLLLLFFIFQCWLFLILFHNIIINNNNLPYHYTIYNYMIIWLQSYNKPKINYITMIITVIIISLLKTIKNFLFYNFLCHVAPMPPPPKRSNSLSIKINSFQDLTWSLHNYNNLLFINLNKICLIFEVHSSSMCSLAGED